MMGTIASMAIGLTPQPQTRGGQGSGRADGAQPAGLCSRWLVYGRRPDVRTSASPGCKRPRLSQLVAAVLAVPVIIMLFSEFATASGHIEVREEVEFEGTFSDDETSIHEYNIEFLVQQGFELGCGDNRFCPSSAVTRAQMLDLIYQTAIHLYGSLPYGLEPLQDAAEHATRADAAEMLVAVFGHLLVSQDSKGIFADMDDMPEAITRAVEYLYGTGVVQGCATDPLRFCPSKKITRAQMASFLARVIQADNPTVGLVLNEPDSAKGYALFSQLDYTQVYLVDDLGRKVHVWTLDSGCFLPKLLENGNLMCLIDKRSSSSKVAEISHSGNTVWEYTFPGMHHDFIKLPNGNILLLLSYFIWRDEAIAAGANPDCVPTDGIRTDYLFEIKPTGAHSGKVVWEWHVWDHLIQDLYPDKSNYGVVAEHPERIDINFVICSSPLRGTWRDWTHINALDFNPISNQIMLSARNFSELWVIDHSTTTEQAAGSRGDLLYRWGNPGAYRAGQAEDQEFFWQHHAHWISSGLSGHGNILVFNNGTNGRGFSSVDEIIPPPSLAEDSDWRLDPGSAAEPAKPIWTYTAENPTEFFAPFKSAAQRISNGNTFITVSYLGTIFQVTSDKRIVWKYVSPVTEGGIIFQGEKTSTDFNYNGIYRATWYPHDYPGLQGLNLTPEGPIELYR